MTYVKKHQRRRWQNPYRQFRHRPLPARFERDRDEERWQGELWESLSDKQRWRIGEVMEWLGGDSDVGSLNRAMQAIEEVSPGFFDYECPDHLYPGIPPLDSEWRSDR